MLNCDIEGEIFPEFVDVPMTISAKAGVKPHSNGG